MNCFLRAMAAVTQKTAFACGDSGRVEHAIESSCDAESVQALLGEPVRNIGRFPDSVRAACMASALAMRTAGIRYPDEGNSRTAILSTGYAPTLDVNHRFFRDYIDAGRNMGRGNLFIYTLPTSAAAEVSIHFGLRGATFFIESETAPLVGALSAAADLIGNARVGNALLLWQDATDTLCLAVSAQSAPAGGAGSMSRLFRAAAGWRRPAEALEYFMGSNAGL